MLLLEDKYEKMVNILNKHIVNKEFGTYDCDDHCPEVTWIEKYLTQHSVKNISVAYGVSKIALISSELDHVLKVPFLGRFYEIYDKECDDYKDQFESFEYADGEHNNDYCKKEVNIYACAVNYGIEMLFAKSERFCWLDCGIPVYKQLKVVPYAHSDARSASPAALKTVKSNNHYYYAPCCNEWKALVIDYYGQEVLDKFINFIDNVCPEVGEDLHQGNYGYTLDGRPILLDYSGWGDC
jgi:hypothetical protein